MEPVAAAKNIRLNSHVQAGVFVHGDANWIERAILNLLDNAIKFTDGGRKCRCDSEPTKSRCGATECRIRESEFRLMHSHMCLIVSFAPSLHAQKAWKAWALGWHLAKWIVEKHRGHIEVQSQIGKGSSFTIRLR